MGDTAKGELKKPTLSCKYDPTEDGLSPDFSLLNYSKVPQDKLLEYLKNIGNEIKPNQTPGMDCSVVETSMPGIFMVSTTDFFYPSIEDPYLMGRIACCNVLSDLYAMGVDECDTMLMLLSASTDMKAEERDVMTTKMMKGFNDTATEANTSVTGGQTVLNPWPMIGGTATSIRKNEDIIRPNRLVPGDVLVLTKPLGTQVAVNVGQWMRSEKWSKVAHVISKDQAQEALDVACESMSRLNRNGARLMRKYDAHGATDVTGFGIKGHANNLTEHQEQHVALNIHSLPIVRYMAACEKAIGGNFKLFAGRSAETSGGLLVALSPENAQAFVDEISELDGQPAWIIGEVASATKDTAGAFIAENPNVIDA